MQGSIVHQLGKMFSGQEKILDEMGTITLAKDALKLYSDVDPGKYSYCEHWGFTVAYNIILHNYQYIAH